MSSYIIGQPLTIKQLYHYIGVDPQTGVYEFADNKGTPTFNPSFVTDRTALINIVFQNSTVGLQNSFTYKGFQLDIFLQFVKNRLAQIICIKIPRHRNWSSKYAL